ncbi:sensor histidine kinase [Phytoactinopolyspora limicola]|uniref:sensor histidine kinase n=1 Tax=Phytoactinopolyspora limicola TaxID=2715536 RepID=UPI001A9C3453|nr:histidine kinase [Phytoactinopolyspora limicola]
MTAPNRWVTITSTTGLASVFAGVIVIQAVAIAQSWGGNYWLWTTAAALVVCVLALLRRRWPGWPVVVALLVAALSILIARLGELPAEPSPALALGLSVLVGAAIRNFRHRPAIAVAVAGLAVVVGSELAARPTAADIATVTVINATTWLAGVAVGSWLRMLDRRAEAVADDVRRAERLDVARELHDVVAHHITGVLIQAQAARTIARRDPEQAMDVLTGIETASSDALAAMRRVVGLLRDADGAPIEPTGAERLDTLVDHFRSQGLAVQLDLIDDDSDWPPEVRSTVYRTVREALTNTLRHASQARSVTVTVGQEQQAVTVEVVDDGPPVQARTHHRGGYGLIGMRERVETLGGTLHAGPRSGAGWAVHATVPLSARKPR